MISSLDGKIKLSYPREFKENQIKRFSLKINSSVGNIEEVKLYIYKYNISTRKEIGIAKNGKGKLESYYISQEISFNETGLYFFCIYIKINGKENYIKADVNWRPILTLEDFPFFPFVITSRKFEVPNWAKGKIMMQIIVDRFARDNSYAIFKMPRRTIHEKWNEMPDWKPDANGAITNTDFFAGNIRGIISKLDYIKKLNVKIIYLTPILQSQSNHRYDTADYERVDIYAGEICEMKELCEKAHNLGIHIILDTVVNHTGNDSRYFNEFGTYSEIGAFQSNKSKYYNWYKKVSFNQFAYWWNFKNLPECDTSSEEWREYLFSINGVIDKWFSWGIDGLRIDVADELTDIFLEELRSVAKRNKKDVFIIGEVWENAMTKKKDGNVRTYLHGNSLDSVMNYPFTDAILKYMRFGDYKCFNWTINEILHEYPKEAGLALMNSLSTHDITRAITTLVGDGIEHNKYEWTWDIGNKNRNWQFEHDKLSQSKYEQGKKLFKLATIIQYFLPGNPCIYYGDEAGVHGYKDPFNRKPYPWGKEDKELLQFFIELGNVRSKFEYLRKANCRIIEINERILIFERYCKKRKVIIGINRSDNQVEYSSNKSNFKLIFNINNSTEEILNAYGAIILAN